MATTRIFFDTRVKKTDGTSPVRLAISHHGKTAYITTNIAVSPKHWQRINGKVDDAVYFSLMQQLLQVQTRLSEMALKGELKNKTASDIKAMFEIKDEPEDMVRKIFQKKIDSLDRERTRELYFQTLKKMEVHCDISKLRFEDITPEWVDGFDKFMAKTCTTKNGRNIHLRNLRTIVNLAIDEGVTDYYAFRKYKIRNEPTRKRSLSVEQLHRLFNMPLKKYDSFQRDIFKLMFLLIGINATDLFNLKHEDYDNGRITYARAKTSAPISIKVEPEAKEIIEKYKGKKNLLCLSERYKNVFIFVCNANKSLKRIGINDSLSGYWARHSWATVAYNMGFSLDVIGQSLGHSDKRVANIYTNKDVKLVDKANRAVIDYVLYNKKTESEMEAAIKKATEEILKKYLK